MRIEVTKQDERWRLKSHLILGHLKTYCNLHWSVAVHCVLCLIFYIYFDFSETPGHILIHNDYIVGEIIIYIRKGSEGRGQMKLFCAKSSNDFSETNGQSLMKVGYHMITKWWGSVFILEKGYCDDKRSLLKHVQKWLLLIFNPETLIYNNLHIVIIIYFIQLVCVRSRKKMSAQCLFLTIIFLQYVHVL